MNTTVTLSLYEIGMGAIWLCLLILLVYLIFLVKNLVASVKHANKLMADAEVISEIAARRGKEADKLLGDASEVLGATLTAAKGSQNAIKTLGVLISGLAYIKSLFGKKEEKEAEGRDKRK